MPRRLKLKVCCIQSVEEARLAVSLGADHVGLVAAMPSGPGPISDELIADIARTVPPGIGTFLLSSRTGAEALEDHVRRCGCNTLQICDLPEPGTYRHLRRTCPGVRLVQVIHVQDEDSIEEARRASAEVDALLLDSGRTRGTGPVELGGTGRIHDWALSARIVAAAGVAVFLAGGLRAENVAEAVRAVAPFGVDLCNGVRTGGALDAEKLRVFVGALENAARAPLANDPPVPGTPAAIEAELDRRVAVLARQSESDREQLKAMAGSPTGVHSRGELLRVMDLAEGVARAAMKVREITEKPDGARVGPTDVHDQTDFSR